MHHRSGGGGPGGSGGGVAPRSRQPEHLELGNKLLEQLVVGREREVAGQRLRGRVPPPDPADEDPATVGGDLVKAGARGSTRIRPRWAHRSHR